MTKTLNPTHKGISVPITYNSLGHIKEVERHGKFFEYGMLEAIEKLPYRPGICMDIGANVGNHTVFFSKFCKFDEVWAFEPSPNSFELLKYNLLSNESSNVNCFYQAVGSHDGFVRMTDNKYNPSWNKVTDKNADPDQKIHPLIAVQVKPITTEKKVALMKIDVEGYELEVIKGAYEVIERERPELFIEWHDGYDPILNALPKGYSYVKTYNNAPSHHFTAL